MNDLNFLHSTLDVEHSESGGDTSDLKGHSKLEVFLVEDDDVLCRAVEKSLNKHLNVVVHPFSSPRELLNYLESRYKENKTVHPFCLISDISFDEGVVDGLLLIDLLRERNYRFVSIVMTGFGSVDTAISATKKGVFHYLTKPFETNVLLELVVKAVTNDLGYNIGSVLGNDGKEREKSSTPRQRDSFGGLKLEPPTEKDMFFGIIGRSVAMKKVFGDISRLAQLDDTVILKGDLGSGKSIIAKAMHDLSKRSKKRMVTVNCGSIPGELMESELFGHVKGAFVGALSDRIGRFELATGGTVFLDEIGDMPLLFQVKLLRVLQRRVVERVGDSKVIPIDARFIMSTHRDLESSICSGDFREDLYNAINVTPIVIPKLAERKEDIPLLISYFLHKLVSADGRNSIKFDDEAVECLMDYDWPGNVKELENLIERLVIMRGGSIIRSSDLPVRFTSSNDSGDTGFIKLPHHGLNLKRLLSNIEDSLIIQALEFTNGNKNRASKLLQLNRTTLIEKMKKKGLSMQEHG